MSDDLFVIQNVYLEGKKVHLFLKAVAGIIVKADLPRPVINAVMDKSPIRQASNAKGVKEKVIELVRQFNKGTDIPSTQFRTIVERAGGRSGGAGYYTQMLKEQKILKLKHRGLWTVI